MIESHDIDRIVIRPVKKLSGDRSQGFSSDGPKQEFRAALTRNDALGVIAGTSTRADGSAGEDPMAIARTLAVASVA